MHLRQAASSDGCFASPAKLARRLQSFLSRKANRYHMVVYVDSARLLPWQAETASITMARCNTMRFSVGRSNWRAVK